MRDALPGPEPRSIVIGTVSREKILAASRSRYSAGEPPATSTRLPARRLTRFGANFAPLLPTAARIRPQFGSPPGAPS